MTMESSSLRMEPSRTMTEKKIYDNSILAPLAIEVHRRSSRWIWITFEIIFYLFVIYLQYIYVCDNFESTLGPKEMLRQATEAKSLEKVLTFSREATGHLWSIALTAPLIGIWTLCSNLRSTYRVRASIKSALNRCVAEYGLLAQDCKALCRGMWNFKSRQSQERLMHFTQAINVWFGWTGMYGVLGFMVGSCAILDSIFLIRFDLSMHA